MALPIHRNPISLGQIREEFSGPGGQISLNDYHAGWGIVSPGTIGYPYWQATPIPSSGQISLGNFHGATRQQIFKLTYSQTWTSPITGNISMILVAGAGSGGCGGGDEGGGGGGAGGVLYVQNIWVQQGQAYWIHIGRGASIPVDHRTGVQTTIRSTMPPDLGQAYDGYCIDHAEHSVAFGYTAQRGGNGGFWNVATRDKYFQPSDGTWSSNGNYVNRNTFGHNHFDLLPERQFYTASGIEQSFVLGSVGFTGLNPYFRSDWTKSGWVGGSGGGATGRNGRADGSQGTVGQGNAGATGGEEGDSGGGGGAGSGGYSGNRGGGEGRTFYIGNEVLTVGGGGACGPGWWNSDYIPGGSGGGGGKSKWAISENGAPNTGGGGAGGSAGNWADAGPYKGGGGGGSGLCWIMIGY